MALKITRNADGTSEVGSGGSGTPLTTHVQVTNTGGSGETIDSNTKSLYLFADDNKYYSDIQVSFISEAAGIDYKVSLNNATFTDTVSPADIDALASSQNVPIYVKAEVLNDGTFATATVSTTAKMRLERVEHAEDPN